MEIPIYSKQMAFINAATRGAFFISGIGAGKSRVLSYRAILDALNGIRTAIISFSYRTLRDVNYETLKECLNDFKFTEEDHYVINKTEMIFTIKGTQVLLRSADEPGRLRGLNLGAFYLDEMREYPDRSTLDIMLGRLRIGDTCHWGGVSSPAGRNWFYDIIVSEGLDPWGKPDRIDANKRLTVIAAATYENPFLPDGYIDDLRKSYTSLYASQELDGNIVNLAGHVIDSTWFKLIDYHKPLGGVRYWDFAVSTEEAADYSAGALMSWSGDKVCLNDVRRVKMAYPDLRRYIIRTAQEDGPTIILAFEKAGQQQAMIDDFRRDPNLRRYVIRAERPRGDKLGRALPWISQAELRNMVVCRGNWNRNYFEECDAFNGTGSKRDDQIDAVSGAYNVLTNVHTVTGRRQAY
jgi:predicted phage terminase large subunit-like protein